MTVRSTTATGKDQTRSHKRKDGAKGTETPAQTNPSNQDSATLTRAAKSKLTERIVPWNPGH